MSSPIDPAPCGSASLVRGDAFLQEKWLLLIVSSLRSGPSGFNELARKAEGVSATILSQRLSLLEEAGLVAKTVHSNMPPRTSYELTEGGYALGPVLDAIQNWSDAHLPERNDCPLTRELESGGE